MRIDNNVDNGASLAPGITGHVVLNTETGTGKGKNPFRRLAHYLSKKEFVGSGIKEHVDVRILKQKPRLRIYAGLVLIALTYIMGWPAVALLGIISSYADNKLILVIGGPSIYGFSWLLLIAGLCLVGSEYNRALSRWFVRICAGRHLKNQRD
jgi:hypothetical protein